MAKNKIEKRKFIEDIFGMEIFSTMLTALRTEYNEISKEHDTQLTKLEEIEKAYKNYEAYRKLEAGVEAHLAAETFTASKNVEKLVELNPDYWKAHYLAGRYLYEVGKYREALRYLRLASQKEIPSHDETQLVAKYLKKATRKAK